MKRSGTCQTQVTPSEDQTALMIMILLFLQIISRFPLVEMAY